MAKVFGTTYHLYRTNQQGLPLNTPTVDNRTNSPAQAAPGGTAEPRPEKSRVGEILWRSHLLSLCLTKNRSPTGAVAEPAPSSPITAAETLQPVDMAAHPAPPDRLTTLPPELQQKILAELPFEDRRNYALLNRVAGAQAKVALTHKRVDNLEDFNKELENYGSAGMKSLVVSGQFLRDEDLRKLPPSLEDLDVSGCLHLTVRGLVPALRQLPNIRRLNLAGCLGLDNVGILAVLPNAPQLQSLSLARCDFLTDQGITDVLKRLPHLQKLNLSGCHRLTDQGIIAALRQVPRLQALNLARCTLLTGDGITIALQNLLDLRQLNLSGCRGLATVTLWSNLLQDLDLSACDRLANIGLEAGMLPALARIDLSNCNSMRSTVLHTLLQNSPNLQQLDISRCDLLVNFALPNLPELRDLDLSACKRLTNIQLEEGMLPALTRIDLSSCRAMPAAALNTLLQNIPNLQHLDISRCGSLTDLALPSLPQLRHLDASRCTRVRNANFENQPAIKHLILSGCSNLDTLNLSNLNALERFNARDCTELETLTIANNQNLKKIHIGNCFRLENLRMENLPALEEVDLSIHGVTGRRANLQVLQNVSTKTKVLNISGRDFNDDTMPDLLPFPELDTLDLSRTRISGSSLPERLPASIKTLRMAETRISDKPLSEVLKKCRDLTHLDLSHSPNITGAGLKPLRRQFPVTLQSLNITDCPGVDREAVAKLRNVLPRGVITNP